MSRAVTRGPEGRHRLDRIEGHVWDLDENGVPETHSAVPEAGVLVDQRREPGEGLLRDDCPLGNGKGTQVETYSVRTPKRARYVDGVEIPRLMEQRALARVSQVDFGPFDDLHARTTAGGIGPERSPTFLIERPDDTTHPYGAIQLSNGVQSSGIVVWERRDGPYSELVLEQSQRIIWIATFTQSSDGLVHLLLEAQEQPADLPAHVRNLREELATSDVVDSLYQNDVTFYVAQIPQQRPVAAWMEGNLTGTISPEMSVEIRRDRIRLRRLHREIDLKSHAERSLDTRGLATQRVLEVLPMTGGYGEVNAAGPVTLRGQGCRLIEMFRERGAHAIVVQVKRNKALGQLVVSEPTMTEQEMKNLLQGARTASAALQLRPERELGDVPEHHERVVGVLVARRGAPLHTVYARLPGSMEM